MVKDSIQKWLVALVAVLTNTGAVDRFRDDIEQGKWMAQNYDRGQTGGIVKTIVGLAVGGLVAAFIIPIALTEISDVDTTNFSSGAQSLWNILDVIIALGVFLLFIGLGLRQSGRI